MGLGRDTYEFRHEIPLQSAIIDKLHWILYLSQKLTLTTNYHQA